MAEHIDRLEAIASNYDAIVLDQWGVLHDGMTPYPSAINCLNGLHARGARLAVLSNSGKRSVPNLRRIVGMGFSQKLFTTIMTSGEALWRDMARGDIATTHLFPIERAPGDARHWAQGLNLALVALSDADAILLMGLPDGSAEDEFQVILEDALKRGMPIYCSNPDQASPRSDALVVSPGAIARHYKAMGGQVYFYGKPYLPVFQAVEKAMGAGRHLMVGDSLDHDIAGAANAGWDTLLVLGGLYKRRFGACHHDAQRCAILADLVQQKRVSAPTYTINELQ